MDATQALSLLGENSRWHVRTYLFYSLGVMLASPLFIMSPVFIGKFITTCIYATEAGGRHVQLLLPLIKMDF